jgi:hypothetical protein
MTKDHKFPLPPHEGPTLADKLPRPGIKGHPAPVPLNQIDASAIPPAKPKGIHTLIEPSDETAHWKKVGKGTGNNSGVGK